MALSEEQRTMLQLLLGGQGYDDIGGLLGVPRDEVRARARAALREMGGADPDDGPALTDFLLGKADPIGRADAVRQLQHDPSANRLASTLVAQLRLLAPGAELPEIPPPRGGRGQPEVPSPSQPPASLTAPGTQQPAPRTEASGGDLSGPFSRVRESPRALLILGAIALLSALAAVVVILFGGGGDGSGEATTTTAGDTGSLAAIQLGPLSEGSEATGQAAFGRVKDGAVLRINLAGLEPTGSDQNYIIWLYNSDQVAFPLGRNEVGEDGNLIGDAPIPNAVVPLLGQFGCIDVSVASNAETQAALRAAVKGRKLPSHAGDSVLRGEVPRQGQETASGVAADCEVATPAAEGTGTTTAP
jgi:hypothetical protein